MKRRTRLYLGFSDQVLSSASNFLMLFAVARVSSVQEFGFTAVTFTVFTMALAVVRGSIGTPLLLKSDKTEQEIQMESGFAVGAVLISGSALAALLVILYTAQIALSSTVLAIAIPFVMAQDVQRYGAMARSAPHLAAIWDGVWAFGAAIILVLTWTKPAIMSPFIVISGWAACGIVSFVGLSVGNKCQPAFVGLHTWLASNWPDRLRYILEAGSGPAASLMVAAVAAALIGPQAAAALRGAGTVFGPLSVIVTAIPLAIVPELIRSAREPSAAWHLMRRAAICLSLIACTLGVGGAFLPTSVGHQLLGSTWTVVKPLLPFTGIEYAGVAWYSCIVGVMRAQGLSAGLLKSRVLFSLGLASSSVAAAVIWQTTRSMAIGLATGSVTVALALVLVATTGSHFGPAKIGRWLGVRIVD